MRTKNNPGIKRELIKKGGDKMKKKILIWVLCVFTAGIFASRVPVYAANENDTQALQQQVNILQQEVQQLKTALEQNAAYNNPAFGQELNPFWQMDRMQNAMNRMIGSGGIQNFGNNGFYNANVDIKATRDQYIITMDLPGMNKSAINIETQGNELIVSGERKQETQENNKAEHYYRRERSFGYFSRTIPLPKNADKTKINATYKNGVLVIKINKIKPSAPKNTAHKIKIN